MFRNCTFTDLNENIFRLIGKEMMLITAGTVKTGYNTMTASWGFAGEMWGNESVAVVVRPQRYTMEFLEKNDYFTLCFFGDNKKVHQICGNQSGRQIDKATAAGITPSGDDRYTYFKEARLVLLCKKQYASPLNESGFTDKSLLARWYPENDLHNLIIGKVERVYLHEKDKE